MNKRIFSILAFFPFLICCNSTNKPNDNKDLTNYWPGEEISSFLLEKGISDVEVPEITVYYSDLLDHGIGQKDDYTYYYLTLSFDLYQPVVTSFSSSGYTLSDGYYHDTNNKLSVSISQSTRSTNVSIYDSRDLTIVEPPIDDIDPPSDDLTGTSIAEIDIQKLLGKSSLSSFTATDESSGLTFTANVAEGSSNPVSTNDNGGYVAIYGGNTLSISGKTVKKIEFNFSTYGSKVPDISVNEGTISKDSTNNYLWTWVGESDSLVFTSVSQSRYDTCKIWYYASEEDIPVLEGVSTIKEVLDAAKTISYTPNSSGWYLSNMSVTINCEAIDCIDSISTSGGLDGNARGKVLVVDETGYILVSSATSGSGYIPFYQRVKDYLKAGTTQYEVTGHVAFLNGVVEIKVDTYSYKSSLVIDKKYEEYVKHTYSSSSDFVNDAIQITPNPHGYGSKDVIRMTGLTYFNKYNSAGSYLFLDQQGNIVPVYSYLDKDRTSLVKGHCYDIIGLETLYTNRPSLRVLKVVPSTLEPVTFDFVNDVVSLDTVNQFYNLKQSTSEEYVKSELTVYKVHGYVSSYGDDKYTFNVAYYKGVDGVYTTGDTENNAVNHYSLGIFNEDLDYKQTLLDFDISRCSSEEEVKDKALDLYFTLARVEQKNKKNYWRINIFEELVFSLDYANARDYSVTFNSTEMTFTHDEEKQVYQKDGVVVTNYSTSLNTYSFDPTYLKVNDGTRLTISYSSPIIGFILYHRTYSYITGFGNLSIRAYKQYASYTEVLLSTPTTSVDIDDFMVSSSGNTHYLHIDSLTIKY